MTNPRREQGAKALRSLLWVPAYAWQRLTRRVPSTRPVHLMITIANHFEPEFVPGAPGRYVNLDERERRVETWCLDYPKLTDPWRDIDGFPLRQTYFYPAEHYEKRLIDCLAAH